MPTLKDYCSYPLCVREAIEETYCHVHAPIMLKGKKEKAKGGWDKDSNKFYNSKRWIAVRNMFRELFPLCQACLRLGKHTPMHAVDHIKPLKEGGDPFDFTNLESLCESCHNRKSAQGRE